MEVMGVQRECEEEREEEEGTRGRAKGKKAHEEGPFEEEWKQKKGAELVLECAIIYFLIITTLA
jgi:hypothetical protein